MTVNTEKVMGFVVVWSCLILLIRRPVTLCDISLLVSIKSGLFRRKFGYERHKAIKVSYRLESELDGTLPNTKKWRIVTSELYTEASSFSLGVHDILAVFSGPPALASWYSECSSVEFAMFSERSLKPTGQFEHLSDKGSLTRFYRANGSTATWSFHFQTWP
jgi:hypothetical protein